MSSPSAPPRHQPPRGIRQGFRSVVLRMRGGELTARRIGLSVALGLFIGVTPLYGLHLWLTALLTVPLRLDFFVAYLAANISIPPFVPAILFVEVQTGTYLLRGEFLPLTLSSLSPDKAAELGVALALGTLAAGTVLALVGGSLAWFITTRVLAARARS